MGGGGVGYNRFMEPKKAGRAQAVWRWLYVSRREEIPFIVFLSFLLSFAFSRLYVYVTDHDIMNMVWLNDYVSIRGIHIHHFVFGIIILAVIAYIALNDIRPVVHRRLAVLYGISLGLIFDEFALWLRLKDDYQARLTYDAVVTISLVFLNIIYFPGFWKRMGKRIRVMFVKRNWLKLITLLK
jgi:hypothetical protein